MKQKMLLLLFVIIFTLSLSGTAFALGEVYTGGYRASDVAGLKYIISGSPGGSYDNDIIQPAAYDWNFISSKVSLTYNSSGAKMSVIVKGYSGSDVLGRMYPYYKNISGGLSVDTALTRVWECTDVVGYDETMNDALFLNYEKRQVYCHEMGHALSLAHVTNGSYSVMKPSGTDPYSPSTYDKSNLKNKWGS
jgi:hypothetical protein